MRYAVIGGDMRFVHLVSMLNEAGRTAAGFLQDRANDGTSPPLKDLRNYSAIVANWPMRWPLANEGAAEEEIFSSIEPGSVLLLCGPKFPKERRWDLQYVNLWEDEQLLQENAYLTAEVAVDLAMHRGGRTLLHARCAVVGYGRIGRALTEILLNMGAHVTVISRTEAKRRQAIAGGAQAMELARIGDALEGRAFIFSTPPAGVIDGDALKRIDRDAVLMDLASPPYGFDLEEARKMGLQACREPGLPGRYCPLSAARAVYHAVLRWEEAEQNG